jgi:hypothetical protein
VQELLDKQKNKCFICGEQIIGEQETDIDHIIPGKDEKNNLAITHASCNRSKQDSNLEVARTINLFYKLERDCFERKGVMPDLSDVLALFDGSKSEFHFELNDNSVTYSVPDNGGYKTFESPLLLDIKSGAKSFFANMPIEYVFHDERGLNPRRLSYNLVKFIKEFYTGRPQLHVGLARLNIDEGDNNIYIFDGQHKAAAQILLGARKLLLRVFVNPDIEHLAITNERAGHELKQVAFDKSVQRQFGSTILSWKIERFQRDKGLEPDDFPFSEKDLVAHFKGEGTEVKGYIHDYLRTKIIEGDNELKSYIQRGGRGKDKPLSYASIEKTFYSFFIGKDLLDDKPFFCPRRETEVTQVMKMMNLVAEEILNDFDLGIGIFKIEEQVRKASEGKSKVVIPDKHLVACRMTKEEIMYSWLLIVREVIKMYFTNQGKYISQEQLFQQPFDDQLWENIRNALKNLRELPVWVDRERTYLFTKKNQDYWHAALSTGVSTDGTVILNEGVNLLQLIHHD